MHPMNLGRKRELIRAMVSTRGNNYSGMVLLDTILATMPWFLAFFWPFCLPPLISHDRAFSLLCRVPPPASALKWLYRAASARCRIYLIYTYFGIFPFTSTLKSYEDALLFLHIMAYDLCSSCFITGDSTSRSRAWWEHLEWLVLLFSFKPSYTIKAGLAPCAALSPFKLCS
jgi:hypothetical protein